MAVDVEREDRSAYDARKSYINVLERVLLAEKEAAMVGDLEKWVRCLSGLHSMCYAYCDRQRMEAIRARLLEAQRLSETLRVVKMGFRNGVAKRLDALLHGIQLDLHAAASHLMLPVSDKDDDDFDVEEFAEGSDL